jgi:hypothetical protein
VLKLRSLLIAFALVCPVLIAQARESTPSLVNSTRGGCAALASKRLVGGIEVVQIHEIPYLARVDTGANTSSLNAYDLNIDNEETNPTANIGKWVHFTTANEKGIAKQLDAKIVKTENVRNAQGAEARYVVSLPIHWHGISKTIEVNLRDRSAMQYSLLLGRNWLKDDFVVDVGKGE